MEKEIVSIILQMLNTNLLKELYDKRATEYDFPPKLNADKLPFNVVVDFNKLYFDKYKDILIENSIIYAIRNNDKIFIEFFCQNLKNLSNLIDNEPMFKIKLSEYAIKHIINKHYDKDINDNNIKSKYSNIFSQINSNSTKILSFTNMYRKIIIEFIKNNEKNNENEYFLDSFLSSTYYDELFIKSSNGLINSKNIIEYKRQLIRLIFADVYVILENETKESNENYDSLTKDEKLKCYLEELKEIYGEDSEEMNNTFIVDDLTDEEFADDIDKTILNYIHTSIKNNKYVLPQSDEIRLNLYAIFIAHNSYPVNRKLYRCLR